MDDGYDEGGSLSAGDGDERSLRSSIVSQPSQASEADGEASRLRNTRRRRRVEPPAPPALHIETSTPSGPTVAASETEEGTAATAAAVGVAVWLSAGRETSVVGPIQSSIVKLMLNTPVELYDRLTGGGRQDVVTIAAHAAGDDGASDVEAQFLVDPATNEAVIRISGLPSTAGTETRYQVWVQDAGRSDPHPVSGGLVSIPFEGASYVLKVEPSVPIIRAVGFAITREARGGAVVSRPDRIVVRGELMDARQYGPFEPIEDMQGGDGSRGNEPGPDVLTKP